MEILWAIESFAQQDILLSAHSCGSILIGENIWVFYEFRKAANYFMTIFTNNNKNFWCLLAFLMMKIHFLRYGIFFIFKTRRIELSEAKCIY